jgi:hypothetical protein
MDDFTKALVTAAVSLVSAVVGGLMVLAGQYIHDRRIRENDTRKKKAEKLEELLSALWEHERWLILLKHEVHSGEDDHASIIAKLATSPFAKIEAISCVYFGDFHDDIEMIDGVSDKYVNALMNKLYGQIASDLYDKHEELCDRLRDKIKDYARKNINT